MSNNETSTLTNNLEHDAIPKIVGNNLTYVFETIKTEIMQRKQHKDIYTFNLTLHKRDYAVTVYAPNSGSWLLVFNKRRSNTAPLAFKLLPGFRIVTYYNDPSELFRVQDFFQIKQWNNVGGLKMFFQSIDTNLLFIDGVPIEERLERMEQHDPSQKSDERDKIYFDGFMHLGLDKDGKQRHRSAFNTWKVQHILPIEVWEQIRHDNTISVVFVTQSDAHYTLSAEESSRIKEQISSQLKHK